MTTQEIAALAKEYLFAFPKVVSNLQCPLHMKFIADKIQYKIEHPTNKYQLLIISEPPRHGKCLSICNILDIYGDKINIKNIKNGTKILSMTSDYKLKETKIIKKVSSGKKKKCILTLNNGQEIESSNEHRYYVFNKGWVQLKDLTLNDFLAFSWPINFKYKNNIDQNDAYLIGIWYADGYKNNKDNIPIQYLRSLINTNVSTYNFRIPSCIWTADNSITSKFINAFISCDGYFNKYSKVIEVTLANKKFLLDLQLLLRRFRIRSKVNYKKSKFQNGEKDSWLLTISDKESILNYHKYIGSISKQNELDDLKNEVLKNEKSNSKSYVLPPEWRTLLKHKPYWFRKYHNIRIDKSGCTHIDKIRKCAEIENNIELLNLIDNDIEWVQIKSIEYTNEYIDMYDLYVEDEHNFIANGIVVHNSMLISKHAVPWFLGKFPDKRVILTSYSSDLSEDNSDFAKDLFAYWGPILWNIKPSDTLYKRKSWNTEKGGGCIAVGFGGQITGFGADLFIIDDYFKGHEQSESKIERDKLWDTWQSIAGTRLHPGALVVILSTRWNNDDLIGRLLQQAKDQGSSFPFDYEYINLPAIANENDPLGRKKGEALWPQRYNIELLNNIRNLVGPYWWNALYQGEPVNKGGNLFKYEDFRYYEQVGSTYICYRTDEEPIRIDKSYIKKTVILDPALEMKRKNDPSNMLAWGYSNKHKIWLLLDRLNGRINHKKLRTTTLNFAFKNNANKILVENEKLGKILKIESEGKDEINGMKIPFKEVKTKGLDKYARAVPMATYIENQRVFFPKNAPWLITYQKNLTDFPTGEYDEDVDCTAYAKELEKNTSITDALSM